VVKVIWQQAALRPHIDGSIVFTRWRQCASHLTHASLGQPESKSQRHFDRFSCTATTECLYTLQWAALSPLKIAPSCMGSEAPPSAWFLGPTWVLNLCMDRQKASILAPSALAALVFWVQATALSLLHSDNSATGHFACHISVKTAFTGCGICSHTRPGICSVARRNAVLAYAPKATTDKLQRVLLILILILY